MDRTDEKILALRKGTQALYLEVPEAIMAEYSKLVEAVITTTLEWRKRAAQHGCNTEKGDGDCG